MEETGKGHQQWDRQGWNRLKRRDGHGKVNLKRISESVPSCTLPVAQDFASYHSWLSRDPQIPLPCQVLCCSLLLISSVTYCCYTSDSQVAQVHAMA